MTIIDNRAKGFGLIELMVVVSLLAIFSAIAMPAFKDLISSNQVLSAANEVYGILQYARGESMTRGTSVTVSAAAPDAWTGDIYVKAGEETLRHYEKLDLKGVATSSGLDAIFFCPSGFIGKDGGCNSGALASTANINFYNPDNSNGADKNITIFASGQVSRPE
jgi:prepilin-type N-terminal cleavage/methylation domain-containing protein